MSTDAQAAVAARLEGWIRTLLVRAAGLHKQTDPDWRHAYGIAQGAGVQLKSAQWPPFPTAPGCAFQRLVGEEEQRRAGGAPPPRIAPQDDPFSVTALPPCEGSEANTDRNAEQLVQGYLRQARAQERTDPAWRHALGVAQGYGALRQTAAWPGFPEQPGARFLALGGAKPGGPAPAPAPKPTKPPSTPTPPGSSRPSAPRTLAGEVFRAMPTLMDAEESDLPPPPPIPAPPSLPTPAPAGAPAFRAMPTLMEEGDDSGEPSEVARAMPTLMELDDEELGAGGGEAFRAQATLMEAEEEAPAPRAAPPRPAPGKPSLRDQLRAQPAQPQAAAPPPKGDDEGGEHLERIGPYRIMARLGKGAMGQVFKGEDAQGQVVAIKVLHPRFGKSKRVRARFLREAKAVERIDHPAVVRFVAAGEEPGVGQYFAMEFVDGDPLHEVLRKRRGKAFELHVALDYSLQICKGMQAAHRAGVIHRDLKPENILVSRAGQVKITDFSLARRDQDSMMLTRPGQVMGTPHFMSPEQARGEDVDARTDLYSLGALIYVLLTGEFPFPNGTVAEVIAAHCEQPRPDPRRKNPQVPDELARIVNRLMAIDRSQRYQTVEALLEDIHASLDLAGDEDEEEEDEEARGPDLAGALTPGTKVGEFVVEGVLGAGGMGQVYRARDGAGNQVALKVLPPQPGRPPQERLRDVRRFLNEAKLARRVVSPGTYRILGHGVDDAGRAFIAASLADGVSLRDLASREGMLSPELVQRVARGVTQALQDIHNAGLVHRDVTPANIMLCGKDFRNKKDAGVCLIDFGLAIPVEADRRKGGAAWTAGAAGDALFKHRVGGSDVGPSDDVDEDELYLEDLPGGTPAYMAPEVLEDPSLVDGRADLYGLGASLYHAATGHPPYSGESMEQVLYQQQSRPPAPITQFNADFPDELSQLIIQLLAREPASRPRSAKLVLSKLQRLEDPGSVPSYQPPPAPSTPQVVTASAGDARLNYALCFGGGILAGIALTYGLLLGGVLPGPGS